MSHSEKKETVPEKEIQEVPVVQQIKSPDRLQDKLKSIEIDAKEKESYFDQFLFDRAYTRTYKQLNNRLTVVLSEMTVLNNDKVHQRVKQDTLKGLADNSDTYFNLISIYRLAQCVETINGNKEWFNRKGQEEYQEEDLFDKKIKEVMSWSIGKLSLFMDMFEDFELRALKLAMETRDNVDFQVPVV